MHSNLKKTLVSSAVTGALLVGTAGFSTAQAELEFNAGAFSDYILWGTSASGNNAVVQGGIDYGHESGFYLGTWVSTLGDDATARKSIFMAVTSSPPERSRSTWATCTTTIPRWTTSTTATCSRRPATAPCTPP
jgi:hypothetical protein